LGGGGGGGGGGVGLGGAAAPLRRSAAPSNLPQGCRVMIRFRIDHFFPEVDSTWL
jgi:hypothetical protein